MNNDSTLINSNICIGISSNVVDGDIILNNINGNINNNTCDEGTTMSIRFNRNNGHIRFNNSKANILIQKNINNGNVGSATVTDRSVNINDTIVNK